MLVIILILAGDIGGTKTHLALFKRNSPKLQLYKERKFKSANWLTLHEVLKEFLDWAEIRLDDIDAASFSVAGPIKGQLCLLTNLNRTINFEELKNFFKQHTKLYFCNDLVATAAGIPTLQKDDLYCLNPEIHRSVYKDRSFLTPYLNRAVIAPGTGVGESILLTDGQICPTEGAHSDFAPQSELQIRLWHFLTLEYGHVSYERILSGPGFVNLYKFFAKEYTPRPTNYWGYLPSPEEITAQALSGDSPLCTRVVELFVDVLAAEAGNLALKSFATGGVFLGGGIPPQILDFLKTASFLHCFSAKGRFEEFLQNIPVYVILNEKTALYGAAQKAFYMLDTTSSC